MTGRYVLEASAALRLFLQDGPIPDGLERAMSDATSGSALVFVPALFHTELLHVVLRLERRGIVSGDKSRALLQDLRALPCRTVEHGVYFDAAHALALDHNLSGYAATYLALAGHLGARLLTADDALARAAQRGS